MKIFTFLLILISLQLASQSEIILEKSKISIPFQFINNLIFIKVHVNGVELTFLLDSGVSDTILFSLENKTLDFKDLEKVRFTGLGGAQFVEGLKSTKNVLSIPKKMIDYQHEIYIILNEDFNFSSHVGIPVHGIIGYHFFKNHPVKFDFVRDRIYIYQDISKVKTKKFEELPLNIEGNKPYAYAKIQMTKEISDAKMLLDLGNSDAVWLFPTRIPNFNYNRPNIDDFLGRGFNGDIYGKRSRIHSLILGKNTLEKPIVSMPNEESVKSMKFVENRIGSIGSDVLKRFSVILDYANGKYYLKKNRNFKDKFKFNMSGLDIKHDGMTWEKDFVKVEIERNSNNRSRPNNPYKSVYEAEPQTLPYKFVLKPIYSIAGIRENSPSHLAGLKMGDLIISINGVKASELTLQKINEMLSSEEDRVIKMLISRKNENITKEFVLKDPIPYEE